MGFLKFTKVQKSQELVAQVVRASVDVSDYFVTECRYEPYLRRPCGATSAPAGPKSREYPPWDCALML